ncbi:hypothetical protein OQJ19_02905 [Fluoribacter gormanii]|uniref:Uncharacterized protein n=1 Tax=Fluoribacter gormanii TaxID=464 RepID=A0A377GGW0_9GAMM|nr:hypothetical protein [Fluoribacter gormanii]KTD02225.1 hypothetical protein Lgor_1981 [Fluoribacter gormanii]MCW8444413.1 hypothetical protein [Fluoribacter gormanii]MCW8469606.1 hypothetical protein [Fluoribacter gormanii]SIR25532.1 hypothetical protein SAMN05421777_10911 [Fluoribacter gormanii]STO24067.1 Uncharacterised protein [Fluoribacter gormanii]
MSTNSSIRPEDILPDGVDNTSINGKIVRKGTIAAFLANVAILEKQNSTEMQKQEAIKTMKELAPSVIAIGLHQHVVFKNKEIEQILIDAE